MIRRKSLPMKMGGLLSLASDGILIGLFGGDGFGLWFGDDDVMDLELAMLDIFTIYDWIPFRSDIISSKLPWRALYIARGWWDWAWRSGRFICEDILTVACYVILIWRVVYEDMMILTVVYYVILIWRDVTRCVILFLTVIWKDTLMFWRVDGYTKCWWWRW
jgi:hypothetical protein